MANIKDFLPAVPCPPIQPVPACTACVVEPVFTRTVVCTAGEVCFLFASGFSTGKLQIWIANGSLVVVEGFLLVGVFPTVLA